MGFFGKNKNDGGMLNVIRCEESDYLIWKWRPLGLPSNRENAIRFGSTLHVKEGEVAVFVYRQNDGTQQDFIEGPVDTTLRTANFPVLSSLLGKAFGGDSPFQAEVYFINKAGNVHLPFFVPEFGVTEPHHPGLAVPVSVKGQLIFNVTDYRAFIRLHRMINFDLDDLCREVKHVLINRVKQIVTNIPTQTGTMVIQLEQQIAAIADAVSEYIRPILSDDFGLNLKRLDISDVWLNQDSPAYQQLTGYASEIAAAQTLDRTERLRMGRDVEFKGANLATENAYIGAHQLDLQAEIARTAAESLGKLGDKGGSSGDITGNPAGFVAGMMLGSVAGTNMGHMMGNAMQGIQQPQVGAPVPPPLPQQPQWFIAENNMQTGPYSETALPQLVSAGRLKPATLVWKNGMPQWAEASTVQELKHLFGAVPPPLPAQE